jgi:hypothetical protein
MAHILFKKQLRTIAAEVLAHFQVLFVGHKRSALERAQVAARLEVNDADGLILFGAITF